MIFDLHEPLAAQIFGDVVVDDALRQAFDNRGLADAGLADQHWIVFLAPREHLDRALDFLRATQHRVELALAREGREVTSELVECRRAARRIDAAVLGAFADYLHHFLPQRFRRYTILL